MAWIRSGYCCRCGECCIGDPFGEDDKAEANPRISQLMRRSAPVAGYCPLYELRELGFEHNGFCAGHTGAVPAGAEDPYYLAGCNVWPDHPDQIIDKPHCTFKFDWRDD